MQWFTDYEEMTILRYVLIIHIIMKVNTIKIIVENEYGSRTERNKKLLLNILIYELDVICLAVSYRYEYKNRTSRQEVINNLQLWSGQYTNWI